VTPSGAPPASGCGPPNVRLPARVGSTVPRRALSAREVVQARAQRRCFRACCTARRSSPISWGRPPPHSSGLDANRARWRQSARLGNSAVGACPPSSSKTCPVGRASARAARPASILRRWEAGWSSGPRSRRPCSLEAERADPNAADVAQGATGKVRRLTAEDSPSRPPAAHPRRAAPHGGACRAPWLAPAKLVGEKGEDLCRRRHEGGRNSGDRRAPPWLAQCGGPGRRAGPLGERDQSRIII
jgi:hypothetical protein